MKNCVGGRSVDFAPLTFSLRSLCCLWLWRRHYSKLVLDHQLYQEPPQRAPLTAYLFPIRFQLRSSQNIMFVAGAGLVIVWLDALEKIPAAERGFASALAGGGFVSESTISSSPCRRWRCCARAATSVACVGRKIKTSPLGDWPAWTFALAVAVTIFTCKTSGCTHPTL